MVWKQPKQDWKAGDTPTSGDFNRIEGNIDYLNKPLYGVTAGSSNAYTVAIPYVVLVPGTRITVKIHSANTGAATLNLNGLGFKQILKSNGKQMSAGNLRVGGVYTLVYDGSVFISQGEGGEGNAVPGDVLSGKTFTNDSDTLTGTMPNRGAIGVTLTKHGESTIIPSGYHNGSGMVSTNILGLVASNIRKGANVGGVIGSWESPFRYHEGTTRTSNFRVEGGGGGYTYKKVSMNVTNEFDFDPPVVIIVMRYPGTNYRGFAYVDYRGRGEMFLARIGTDSGVYSSIDGEVYKGGFYIPYDGGLWFPINESGPNLKWSYIAFTERLFWGE